MLSKCEVSDIVLHYVMCFEKQSRYTVSAIHTDNGTEFSCVVTSLTEDGVIYTTSTVDTPESNELAEQPHQTIMNGIMFYLAHSNLPKRFWNYALRHVGVSRNTVPHSTTGNIPYVSVFEAMTPYLEHMQPFGYCTRYRPKVDNLTTFGSHIRYGITLLVEDGGIYRILTDDGIVRTNHLTFLEHHFSGLSDIGNDRTTPLALNNNDWKI